MAELPIRKRIFYGMAGLTMNLPDLIVLQWLIVRYLPPDGAHLVPAKIFGIIILVARFIEGFVCISVAHISDHCRSRWGRRIPFMRFGILPFALVFFLLFSPPVDHMHWGNAVHLLVFFLVYLTLYSTVVTPYLALIPEITTDLKERIDLTTFQSVFILVGTFIFAALGVVLERWGWLVVAGGAAVLLTMFFLPAATLIREKPRPTEEEHERLHLLASIRSTLRNRPFRYIIAATTLYWFGMNGILALIPNWAVSFLGRGESAVTMLMAPFLVVNLIFFFVFNGLAARFGKYVLMVITFIASGLVLAGLCLVGVLPFGSPFIQTAVVMALFGAPVAGFMVLPFAALADVVDYDERLTGRRREATFFGVQGIFQKAMIGVSVYTFTLVSQIGGDGSRLFREDAWIEFAGKYEQAGAATEPVAAAQRDEPVPGSVRVDATPDSIQAPWTLLGPGGFKHDGKGDEILTDLEPGNYRLEWGDVAVWQSPAPQHPPTPLGLKVMALLCALACIAGGLVFLGYPIRERDGVITVAGSS